MFVKAIAEAQTYTRPLMTISRYYGSTEIVRGTGTLFFVNDEGWAMTCKHIAHVIPKCNEMTQRRHAFQSELRRMRGSQKEKTLLRDLEAKFKFSNKELFDGKYCFNRCVDSYKEIEIIFHDDHDVALIHFIGYNRSFVTGHARFAKDDSGLQPGKSLCRFGFPSPDFDNYRYNEATDEIEWTREGSRSCPGFPLDGMVTSFLVNDAGQDFAFQTSTPGMPGHSGSPQLDTNGVVWGMLFGSGHRDLGFEIKEQIRIRHQKKDVHQHVFMHLAQSIRVEILKDFMRANNVRFAEI